MPAVASVHRCAEVLRSIFDTVSRQGHLLAFDFSMKTLAVHDQDIGISGRIWGWGIALIAGGRLGQQGLGRK